MLHKLFSLAGKLKMQRLLPTTYLKKSNFISNWFFGVSSNFDKELLKTILKETDTTFLTWAINKVVGWTNLVELKNLKQIHGTADRILPIRFVNCNFKVKDGGHFMTLNKANELTKIIRELV
jgi:hypothetical protein